MLFKVIAIAALSGVAFGQAGQTFTNPALPSCATPCLQQMQSLLGCDPTLLSCSCPPLASLGANEQFDECLFTNCGDSGPGDVGKDLGENCGYYSWTVSTIAGSIPITSSPAASTVLNTNPATTSVTSASAGTASSTKSANAAARSDVGMAAMGLAIAAAFAL